MALVNLGGPLYEDTRTGELLVDQDAVTRAGYTGADIGSMRQRRLNRRIRRTDRRGDRLERKEDRLRSKLAKENARVAAKHGEPVVVQQGGVMKGWERSFESGYAKAAAAGTFTAQVVFTRAMKAEDLQFDGTTAGVRIFSVSYGNTIILSQPNGMSTAAFLATAQKRGGFLEGRTFRPGVNLVITANATAANDELSVAVYGTSPKASC